jgi:hypothetical protein
MNLWIYWRSKNQKPRFPSLTLMFCFNIRMKKHGKASPEEVRLGFGSTPVPEGEGSAHKKEVEGEHRITVEEMETRVVK